MILRELVAAALKEDMPNGDVTTESLGILPRQGTARLVAKEDLVLSGSSAFEQSIIMLDPGARVKWHFDEGDLVLDRQVICTIQGDLIQALKAERVALNFLGKLSGIATLTRCFVDRTKHTSCKIIDTRKTTPMYRELEKKAVIHGGGENHRTSLSDAILVKDNHIAVVGGITEAIKRVRRNSDLPIEIEVSNIDQLKEAIEANVERVLLDNMSNEVLKEAMAIIPKEMVTEASGNMKLDRVGSVAELGVNYISVGALTHSAPTADVSLQFDWE